MKTRFFLLSAVIAVLFAAWACRTSSTPTWDASSQIADAWSSDADASRVAPIAVFEDASVVFYDGSWPREASAIDAKADGKAPHRYGSDFSYVLPPGAPGTIPQSVGTGQAAPWVPLSSLLADAGGVVTWADDLLHSTNSGQWVNSITGNSGTVNGSVSIFAASLNFQEAVSTIQGASGSLKVDTSTALTLGTSTATSVSLGSSTSADSISGSTIGITSGAGLTVSAGATSSIATTAGNLTIDAAGSMGVGGTHATRIVAGNTGTTNIDFSGSSSGELSFNFGGNQYFQFGNIGGFNSAMYANNSVTPITPGASNYAVSGFADQSVHINSPQFKNLSLANGGNVVASVSDLGDGLGPRWMGGTGSSSWVWGTCGDPVSPGNGVAVVQGSAVTLGGCSGYPVITLKSSGALVVAAVVQVPDSLGWYIFDVTGVTLSTGGVRFRAGTSGSLTPAVTALNPGSVLITVVTYGGGNISQGY